MSVIQRQLVVFDFDWSLADQDSDRWVFEVLAPKLRRRMKNLKDEIQWTDLVAKTLVELHELGVTREQIEESLRIMPFHPAMVRGVKELKAKQTPETTFLCLSNANQVYIDTILKAHGMTDIFDEIITNPAEWTENGLLKVRRRIDPNGEQHKCDIGCSPNMCKGDELDAYLTRKNEHFDRIIYVGDGSNDFCPTLRLKGQDIVFARSYRALERRIKKDGQISGLVAGVKYWAGAWEVEELFQEI